MCLNKQYPLSQLKPLPKIGWKKFIRGEEKTLSGEFYSSEKKYIFNHWLNEKDFRLESNSVAKIHITTNETYPNGWHVFLRKKDAFNWHLIRQGLVVHKVKIQGIVAYGVQLSWYNGKPNFFKTVVCKKILIPKNASVKRNAR